MPYKDKEIRNLYFRNRTKRRRLMGICRDCNEPAILKSRLCASHYYRESERNKQYHYKNKDIKAQKAKQRALKLKSEHKCKNCTIPLIEGEGVYCINCRLISNKKLTGGGIYETYNQDITRQP
jgi:hypothetical protein